jgi:hypothetical protein
VQIRFAGRDKWATWAKGCLCWRLAGRTERSAKGSERGVAIAGRGLGELCVVCKIAMWGGKFSSEKDTLARTLLTSISFR